MTEPKKTPYLDRYLLFIEYFNKRRFSSAQNVLGEVWLESGGPEKDFFAGLVQVAVSLYHLTEGSPDQALKAHKTARSVLDRFGDRYMGLDVKEMIRQMDDLFSEPHGSGTLPPHVVQKIPKLNFTAE